MTSALASLAGNEDAGAEHHALLPVQPEAGAGTPERRDLEEGEQIKRGGFARVWVCTCARVGCYPSTPSRVHSSAVSEQETPRKMPEG